MTTTLKYPVYVPLGAGSGPHDRTHSLSVQTLGFTKVHNVEYYALKREGVIVTHAVHSGLNYSCCVIGKLARKVEVVTNEPDLP